MKIPIQMPEIDATIPVVSLWLASEGDFLLQGDRLIEIMAGSATFDVPAPRSGYLSARLCLKNDLVTAGQILGYIEIEGNGELSRE